MQILSYDRHQDLESVDRDSRKDFAGLVPFLSNPCFGRFGIEEHEMSTIFMSYAREDRKRVSEIYESLRQSGLNPWMDDPPSPYELEGIPPGQDWDQFIRRKMKESLITLAFLSKHSVAKEGYVQREYRLALNILMEKPADRTYLIPVLLEDCTPPDIKVDTVSLHQLNWYRLHEKGLEYLIDFLKQVSQTQSAQILDTNSQDLEIITLKNRTPNPISKLFIDELRSFSEPLKKSTGRA